MPLKLLPIEEVTACACLSKSTIYLKLRGGEFPKPVQLGDRVRGWLEHEIDREGGDGFGLAALDAGREVAGRAMRMKASG